MALVAVTGLVVSVFGVGDDQDSLEVFDRSQTDAESTVGNQVSEFDGVPASLRLLGDRDGWRAYAYLTVEDDVCLYVITGSTRTGACPSHRDFRVDGIGIARDDPYFDILTQTWRVFIFRWGPTGDLRTAFEIFN